MCGFLFTLVTGVSWFFVSFLYMILQLRFVCCFVFTLVTGVSWFFRSSLNMILQIRSVCGFVFILITWVLQFFVSCLYVLLWFTLGVVLYSHWLQGTMILRKLSQRDSSNMLCAWFCNHIGYKGIAILWFIFISMVSFLPSIVFMWLFCVLLQFKSNFSKFLGVT